MKDQFVRVRFHKILLLLTKDEYVRALRRGRTVQHNRKAAAERRQAGEHGKRLGKTLAQTS